MTTTEKSTSNAAVTALRAAVETAQGQWHGLDWTDGDGSIRSVADALAAGKGADLDDGAPTSWVAQDGSPRSQRHHERLGRLARLLGEREYEGAAELAGDLAQEERDYVEGRAATADEHGDAAVAAAERGDWDEAVRELERACACEREFGDDPTWGTVLALAERTRSEAEAEAEAAQEQVPQ